MTCLRSKNCKKMAHVKIKLHQVLFQIVKMSIICFKHYYQYLHKMRVILIHFKISNLFNLTCLKSSIFLPNFPLLITSTFPFSFRTKKYYLYVCHLSLVYKNQQQPHHLLLSNQARNGHFQDGRLRSTSRP